MKRWMSNVLIVVFAAVFLISGYYLLSYYIDAWKQQAAYDDLAAIVDQVRKDQVIVKPTVSGGETQGTDSTQGTTPEETGPVYVQVKNPKTGQMMDVLAEYAELYNMNSDMVGWISIDGTIINYPVMHRPDILNYYLYRDFYKKYSNGGSLYIREACDAQRPSDNVIIFGHNMKNSGTMFHELLDYTDKNFWQEHRYIRFDTLSERHTYEIVSVFKTSANAGHGFPYHLFVNAENEAEFDGFVKTCKDLAFYDTGVSASYGDKLITLSTCEYTLDNGRLVVVAKRID